MVIRELDVGLIPDTIPPITQVVMREEVDIGLNRPATIPFLIVENC